MHGVQADKRVQEKGKEQATKQERIIQKQKSHDGIGGSLFKQLELPNLKKKEEEIYRDIEFNDIRKTGLMGNIDKKEQ